ncbi:MAG: DUF819 family protein [Bacteroidales bacterium]|nr:DUF819 family protein [Bacteroidales bacterium]MDD6773004.1 DUF819 family protein [Bacteroidales bacterium]
MNILGNIFLIAIYLLAPAAVLRFCRKHAWAAKIGPILILYLIGIIVGNLGLVPFLPEALVNPSGKAGIQELLSSAMVPLAIPLLLYGCTFRRSDTRSQTLALLSGIVAVVVAVVLGFLIFRNGIEGVSGDSAAKIGGMLTGVYTGGTMNLAAIKTMLGVSDRTYVLLNSCDMIVSFLYMTMLLAFGIRLMRRILPYSSSAPEAILEEKLDSKDIKPLLFSRLWWKQAAVLLGVTAVVIALSALVAFLMPEGWFMTVFILLLTSAGIAVSFIRRIRELKIAEDISMYCIYIFSIVVASMADFSTLDLSNSLSIIGYLSFVIFGSLILQTILASLLRIDADTIVICSTSFICSPPFVPMMAAAMKNRRVLIAGLSMGIIGYAIGNYLGLAISRLLLLF